MKSRLIITFFTVVVAASLAAAQCVVTFKDPFGSVLKTVTIDENASAAEYAPSAPPGTVITGWTPALGTVSGDTVYTCTMTGGEGYTGNAGAKVTDTAVLARGGDEVYSFDDGDGVEYVHIYTNTSATASFVNNSGKNLMVRFLAVGGGGAGGYGEWKAFGGGGGGGGIVIGGEDRIEPNALWSIKVGAGGIAVRSPESNTAAGASTIGTAEGVADIATARGGGAGGRVTKYATDTGTGGGGAGDSIQSSKLSSNKPAGAAGTAASDCDGIFYPRAGGADALAVTFTGSSSFHALPGGGGGAGASAPAPSEAEFRAGNGGLGVYSSITGELKVYGVGGGGGGGICYSIEEEMGIFAERPNGILPGIGAYGGGGGGLGTARVPDGGWVGSPAQGTPGADGYGCGGGGGGSGDKSANGNGGSGTVILRYREVEAGEGPEPEPAPGHVASSDALENFMRPTLSAAEPLEITLDPSFVKFDEYDRAAGFAGVYSNAIQNAVQAGRPVVVTFRNGTYEMPIYKNWNFPASCSGMPSAPVIFRAETPGKVRFLGDAPLSKAGFSRITTADRHYERLPSAARSEIMAIDINPNLIRVITDTTKNCGEDAPSTQVYLDGEIQECARWPNRLANGCAGWTNYVTCLDNADKSAVKIRLPVDAASRWSYLTAPTNGVFIHGSFTEPWTDEFARVKSVENGTDITFASKLVATPDIGSANQIQRFAVVNAVEELDAPGEWWLDKENRRLYYYPSEPDFTASSSELYLVSNRGPLIEFEGAVHDVRFEGIEFAYADSICNIDDTEARRIEFVDCSFHSFRKDAMIRGRDIAFRRCRFEHFCGGVMQFRRNEERDPPIDRRTLEGVRNVCEDCEFIDFQHVKVSGTRAIQAYRSGCAVRNCLFDGGGHSAIIFRGNEIFMGWCRSINCLRETIDASVFYTGRDTTYLGNVILGCDFRDSKPIEGSLIKPVEKDKRASALYLDDGVWGGDFIGCTVDNMRQGLWLRGGNLHTFAWNRFTRCDLGMKLDASCSDDEINGFLDGLTADTWFTYFIGKYGIDIDSMRWRAAYPDFAPSINDAATRRIPWNNLVMGNVFAYCGQFLADTTDDLTPTMTFTGNHVIGYDGEFAGHAGFARLSVDTSPHEAPGMTEALARIAALSNAAPVEAYSPNGRARVRFMPDVTARLCLRVEIDGRDLLWPSETGLTVGSVDYGRMTLPVNASVQTIEGAFTQLTFDLERVVDGSRTASVEAQIYDNGVRYRYKVRGAAATVSPGFTVWRVAEGVEAVTEGESDEACVYSDDIDPASSSGAFGIIGPWRTVSTDGELATDEPGASGEVPESARPAIGAVDFTERETGDDTGIAVNKVRTMSVVIANAETRYRYGYRTSPTLEGLNDAEIIYIDDQPTQSGEWKFEIECDPDVPSAFYRFVVTPY